MLSKLFLCISRFTFGLMTFEGNSITPQSTEACQRNNNSLESQIEICLFKDYGYFKRAVRLILHLFDILFLFVLTKTSCIGMFQLLACYTVGIFLKSKKIDRKHSELSINGFTFGKCVLIAFLVLLQGMWSWSLALIL